VRLQTLVADNGFYSHVNVAACTQAGIEPLLAIKRESHHEPTDGAICAPLPRTCRATGESSSAAQNLGG